MSRNKRVQGGVRVKLPAGVTWDQLAKMTPDQIRDRGVFPPASCPCRTPTTLRAAWCFPKSEIDEMKKQEGRDLARFDLDFDTLDHFLPEFPPPIYLAMRPDLGDVSKGKLVTLDDYFELFDGILNPKPLDGLRLLLTAFPQQQFNQTDDRRTVHPSRGVACLDCHTNGHTNRATRLVGDIRPQEFRHRINTPSLRGVNVQRLFGSQRALKTVEDFTEFEQRAAYFDGDPVIAMKKASAFPTAARRSMPRPNSRKSSTSRRPRSSTWKAAWTLEKRRPARCAARKSSRARAGVRAATPRRIAPTTSCTTCRRSGSTSPTWSTE
jgi:cytochrome c peroxidase